MSARAEEDLQPGSFSRPRSGPELREGVALAMSGDSSDGSDYNPLMTTDTNQTQGYAGGIQIAGWDLFYTGKVRDLYRHPAHPGHMLMVATDRLSAFDVVMQETVPDRGRVLTHCTDYWLDRVEGTVPSASVTTDPGAIPDLPLELHELLRGRATWTREAERINVEVVLRAYLAGSGWREYEKTGALWEHPLPAGMQKSSRLREVLVTPTTKAEKDEPIDWSEAVELVGNAEEAERMRDLAVTLFTDAAARAEQAGVVLADTKFEFGRLDGELVLIDEVLTPDSSRFWPADALVEGEEPPSYDKEIVRAYLRSLSDWDRTPPPPTIPPAVIDQTRSRYLELCQILTDGLPEGVTTLP